MRFNRSGRSAAVFVSILSLAVLEARAEESIEPVKLPAIVRRAADQAMPGAKWSVATKETEGRSVSYELEGVNREDDDVSVVVDSSGRVLEVCLELDLSEVPRVVKSALRAAMPGIKVREAMSVARNGAVVGYSFDSVRNGADLEVYVTADGRTVEVED